MKSRLPLNEIGQQGQAGLSALLRVALDGEDIIPRHRAGKGDAVTGLPRNASSIRWIDEIAMPEIEPCPIINAAPEWMRFDLLHLVPAHVRHFQPVARQCPHLFGGKAPDRTGKDAQPIHIPFFAVLKKHLLADADPEKRFTSRGLDDSGAQAARIKFAHAVRHGALPGENHTVGRRHDGRLRRHDNILAA